MRVSSSRQQAFHIVLVLMAVFAAQAARAQGGTIVGTIKLTGTPPANPIIRMGADPNCLKMNSGTRVVQDVVERSSDGGLGNAFVHVQGVSNAPGGSGSVTLDQKGCMYHPRILGAAVGQTLIIRNDDSALHNIHSISNVYKFDQSQPTAGLTFEVPLKSEEVMLHVKCNVHPWMTGYIGIVSGPYFAVSDGQGKFKIDNVPAGKHTIAVWHEVYGPLTQTVDVKAGGTVTADFSYTGSEHPATSQIQEITLPDGVAEVSFVPPSRAAAAGGGGTR
jgi:plastocyanin